MRTATPVRSFALFVSTMTFVVLSAAPALAQEATKTERPWHYWIAPFLLIGGFAVLAAFGVGYYIRVMGGRSSRR